MGERMKTDNTQIIKICEALKKQISDLKIGELQWTSNGRYYREIIAGGYKFVIYCENMECGYVYEWHDVGHCSMAEVTSSIVTLVNTLMRKRT